MGRSTYSETYIHCKWEGDHHGSSSIICQWFISRQSANLGCTHKRNLCYLHECTNRPNDKREEPRSTPRDLQDHRFGNTGNQNHIFKQNNVGCQQARFEERLNRQYSPNYNNYNNYQPSPLGSIPGQKPECHTDRPSQHKVQITRNHGGQSEESAGGIQ